MTFALIARHDNRAVDIQSEKPAEWPVVDSYVVEGDFDREVQLGWEWNGNNLVLPPQPAPRPIKVTPTQARIALHRTGHLSAVEAAVAADPEMKIWFEHASEWQRNNPRVIAMGQQLGMSDADLDALFALAQTIQA